MSSSADAPQPDPPSPDVPYWRDEVGRRTSLQVVLAERDGDRQAQTLTEHADAVCRIVHAAAAARLEGRAREARALAAQASKLCGELVGLWPTGADTPL
jgi:hypothetical protein